MYRKLSDLDTVSSYDRQRGLCLGNEVLHKRGGGRGEGEEGERGRKGRGEAGERGRGRGRKGRGEGAEGERGGETSISMETSNTLTEVSLTSICLSL